MLRALVTGSSQFCQRDCRTYLFRHGQSRVVSGHGRKRLSEFSESVNIFEAVVLLLYLGPVHGPRWTPDLIRRATLCMISLGHKDLSNLHILCSQFAPLLF